MASITPVVSIAEAPPAPAQRPRVVMVATAFASAASAMYFLSLVGMYLSQRTATLLGGNPWLPEDVIIPLTQPNLLLGTLLMSSVTMQWAVSGIKDDDRPHAYLALLITLGLGFCFIVMTAYLYSLMQFDLAQSSVSILFYAITAGHVLMLVAAMVFVVLMAYRALGGQFTSRQHDGMSAAALYWHTTVAVFALIWLAIYITK